MRLKIKNYDTDGMLKVCALNAECSLTGSPLSLRDVIAESAGSDVDWYVVTQKGGDALDLLRAYAHVDIVGDWNSAPLEDPVFWLKRAYWDWRAKRYHSYVGAMWKQYRVRRKRRTFVRTAARIRRRIMEYNPDIIYANTFCNQRLLKQLDLGVPVLTHVRELSETLKLYYGDENPHLLFPASRYLVVCDDAKEMLVQMGAKADSVRVVPVGIDVDAVCRAASDVVPEAVAVHCRGASSVIVGAGQLSVRKGIFDFIRLAEQMMIADRERRFAFVWIGGGELAPAVRQELAFRGLTTVIHITGDVANPFPIMRMADLMLFTAYEDPCPRVLFESVACGTPVVSLNSCGGSNEYFAEGRGIVMDRASLQDAALEFVGLLADLPRLNNLAARQLDRLLERHTIQVVAQAILENMRMVAQPIQGAT